MVKIFKCLSGFYAVSYYDHDLKTWFVFWSGSKNLNDALIAACECKEFINDPAAAVLMIS